MAKSINKPLLKIYPATAARWDDLEELFGKNGACAGCWCMFWRMSRKQWDAQRGEINKEALRKLSTRRVPPGILAYAGREPVGWCAIAPRSEYVRLATSRILRPLDDKPVWSVSCLYVKRGYRRRGVSAELIRGSVAFARKHGARILEAYPIDPSAAKIPDPELWHGVSSAFKAAGFKEVARRSETRPMMRLEIKP